MQRTGTVAGAVVGSAGATMTALGYDERGDLLSIGLTAVIVSAVLAVGCSLDRRAGERNKPAADAYEVGHALGYAQGVDEGHRTARPVVVPLFGGKCVACGHNSSDSSQERRASASALRAKASER